MSKSNIKAVNHAPVIVFIREPSGANSRPIYIPKGDEVKFRHNGIEYSVSIHGAGWIRNQLVTNSHDFSSLASEINPRNIPDSIGSMQRGSICTYLCHGDKIYILPDPLGATVLFRYTSQRIIAYSSDIQALLTALRERGERPQKNINYIIELVATGNGGFNSSSYLDIEAQEPFSFVTISDTSISCGTYSIQKEFFSAPSSRDLAIEETRSEILDNARAILRERQRAKIAHLTGGFDSRLVLSSLLSAKLDPQAIKFNCSGHIELPDKSISTQLCGHLGLTMTNSVGTIGKHFEPGRSLFSTSGLLKFDPPISAVKDCVLISGGYGECFRSFYGQRTSLQNDSQIENILYELYGSTFALDGERLISNDFYNDYKNRVADFIVEAKSKGLRQDAIFDYMYVSKRNRYFVGLISQYCSNVSPRVDPLYSLKGIQTALFLPLKDRAANIVGLELMRSFNEELLGLPFDSDRITPEYEKTFGTVPRKNFNGSMPTTLNELSPNPGAPISARPSAAHIAKAKALKAPLWQVINMEQVQKDVKLFLNSDHRKNIASVFNLKLVSRLATHDLKNRVHLRNLYTVYDSLNWYLADEQ